MISAVIPLRYDHRRQYYGSSGFDAQKRSLEALFSNKSIQEVIVVNHTTEPCDPQIAYLKDTFPSLKIIDLDGPWHFNQSWLLNVGIRHMSQPFFLRVDIDCILQPNIDFVGMSTKNFICCAVCNTSRYTDWTKFKYPDTFDNYLVKRPRNHGWSHVIVHRTTLMEIGGYDERYQVWGGEDTDLHQRLVAYGLEPNYGAYWFLHQDHTPLGSTEEMLSPIESAAKSAKGAFLKDKSIIRNNGSWGQKKPNLGI